MSVNVGSYSIGEIYVGSDKIAEAYVGSELVYQGLQLPVKTFRFKFSDTSFDPSTTLASANLTWTLVNASRGLWDAKNIQTGSTPYRELFRNLLTTTNMGSVRCELVGANASDAIDATNMFRGCSALTKIGKMNLSNVDTANFMCSDCTNLTSFSNMNLDSLSAANGMFYNCRYLQKVPDLGQLPNITIVQSMFGNCRHVETGTLAMYNILSVRVTTATNYRLCFTSCGADTTTGAAELAQIPSGWK
jgi:hypothetical protein